MRLTPNDRKENNKTKSTDNKTNKTNEIELGIEKWDSNEIWYKFVAQKRRKKQKQKQSE